MVYLSLEFLYFFPPEDLNIVHLFCIGFQYIRFWVKNMYHFSEPYPKEVGMFVCLFFSKITHPCYIHDKNPWDSSLNKAFDVGRQQWSVTFG